MKTDAETKPCIRVVLQVFCEATFRVSFCTVKLLLLLDVHVNKPECKDVGTLFSARDAVVCVPFHRK